MIPESQSLSPNLSPRRVGLIACEIFFREVAFLASQTEEVIDVNFLPKGLHDLGGDKMRERLQEEIDRMDTAGYSRIVLAYALCNNGTAGLIARTTPLIIPRAHDCITLFLGSREQYQKVFSDHPGTYFHTTGWMERGKEDGQFFDDSLGPVTSLEQLIEKYGEDNGHYLWETLNPWKHYHKIAYIRLPFENLPDLTKQSQEIARQKGWAWEEIAGDTGLLKRTVCGPYPEDEFLTLQPGQKSVVRHDDRILDSVPVEDSGEE